MAEGLLRHHIQSKGLRIKVDSAGTNGFHNGEGPDRRAQQEMRRHKMDISKQRSRQIIKKDFDDFDLILVMDQSNFKDVTALAGDREDWLDKIQMFVDEEDVPDPYFGGAAGFAHVFELINEAADQWTNQWMPRASRHRTEH